MNLNEIIYKYSKIISFIEDSVSLEEIAEKSIYSLSTVKRVIHDIEEEYGISFYLNKRQRVLTHEGKLVKAYFESVYKNNRQFVEQLTGEKEKDDSLRVLVAYPTTYYDSFMTLISAKSKWIHFSTDYSVNIINEITDNKYYDFGIVFCDESNDQSIRHIQSKRLCTEDLYIISNKEINNWIDLRKMNELSCLTPNLWGYELDTWWSQYVKGKREIAYIPSARQLYQLLVRNNESNFAFVYLQDQSEIQQTNVKLKKVTKSNGEPVSHSMYLIWNPDKILTSDEKKFIEKASSLIYKKGNYWK